MFFETQNSTILAKTETTFEQFIDGFVSNSKSLKVDVTIKDNAWLNPDYS